MTGFPTRMSGSTIILFSNSSTLIHLRVLIRCGDYDVAQLYFNYQPRIVQMWPPSGAKVPRRLRHAPHRTRRNNRPTTLPRKPEPSPQKPKRKSHHRTRAPVKSRQNKVETGKTKLRIIPAVDLFTTFRKLKHNLTVYCSKKTPPSLYINRKNHHRTTITARP